MLFQTVLGPNSYNWLLKVVFLASEKSFYLLLFYTQPDFEFCNSFDIRAPPPLSLSLLTRFSTLFIKKTPHGALINRQKRFREIFRFREDFRKNLRKTLTTLTSCRRRYILTWRASALFTRNILTVRLVRPSTDIF